MTQNREEKKEARALQRRTGWSYTRALFMLRGKTSEEIEQVVTERMQKLTRIEEHLGKK